MIRPKAVVGVVLSVRSVEKSLAWYRAKFGFEKLFDDAPNSKAVIIGKGDIMPALNPLEAPAAAANVDTAHQACIQVLCLEVDESALDRVAEEFPEDKNIVALDGHPKYRSRIIEDPDGHAIELLAWKQA